jgi:DNA-binding transcriptional MerR regulator
MTCPEWKVRGMNVRYMTTAEVAATARTPIETVRYWRHVGKGPKSFKVGRRVLYAVEDVEAWIEDARRAGEAA